MKLNARCCLVCGELHGANLRIAGYEICAVCERGLIDGRLPLRAALPFMRRLAVKTCLTTGR